MNDYTIRLEEKKDYREVENLVRESFWNVYKPGCAEHYVIHCLGFKSRVRRIFCLDELMCVSYNKAKAY